MPHSPICSVAHQLKIEVVPLVNPRAPRGWWAIYVNPTQHRELGQTPCLPDRFRAPRLGVCALLCFAMLCYALLCFAMLCYALLCFAMLVCTAESDLPSLVAQSSFLCRVLCPMCSIRCTFGLNGMCKLSNNWTTEQHEQQNSLIRR